MIASSERHPGIRQRVAAGLIDLCLLAVAAGIATWVGLALQGPAPGAVRELFEGISRLWSGNLVPVAMLVVLVSMALCWAVMAATPGQLLMGCRVGRAGDGRPLNLALALWRSLLLVLLGGAVALPLITVFFDRHRRGIHDWLSFSMVTFEDESRIGLDQWKDEIA